MYHSQGRPPTTDHPSAVPSSRDQARATGPADTTRDEPRRERSALSDQPRGSGQAGGGGRHRDQYYDKSRPLDKRPRENSSDGRGKGAHGGGFRGGYSDPGLELELAQCVTEEQASAFVKRHDPATLKCWRDRKRGGSLLHVAAEKSLLFGVKACIELGLDLDMQRTHDACTPLHLACFGKNRSGDVIECLLESGARTDIMNKYDASHFVDLQYPHAFYNRALV